MIKFSFAVMAQRKGELLKMEMLEKLASLHRELKTEVEMASNAHGASTSAVATAREMLGCDLPKCLFPATHPAHAVSFSIPC